MLYMLKKQTTTSPAELIKDDTAKRVGARIRKIRKSKGLSLSEFGQMVGLSSDRVQKYENGVSVPRMDVINKFADALGVDAMAIVDPNVSSYIGLMYALFELEENFGIETKEIDGNMYLSFTATQENTTINDYIKRWHYEKLKISEELENDPDKESEIKKDYDMWKWTFPKSLAKESETKIKKAMLKKQIAELQKEPKKLD